MKTALISGITGQDGSYMVERRLDIAYAVHGLVRRIISEPFRYSRKSYVL